MRVLKLFYSEKLSGSLTASLLRTIITIITNQYINVTFAHHLSQCSSMVRASHRRSEGYGFDSRQGLTKFF